MSGSDGGREADGLGFWRLSKWPKPCWNVSTICRLLPLATADGDETAAGGSATRVSDGENGKGRSEPLLSTRVGLSSGP